MCAYTHPNKWEIPSSVTAEDDEAAVVGSQAGCSLTQYRQWHPGVLYRAWGRRPELLMELSGLSW